MHLEQRLTERMNRLLEQKRHALGLLAGRLDAASPAKKLSQGYAYVTDEAGKRVSDAGTLEKGQELTLYFHRGGVKAEVTEKIEDDVWKK